MSDREQCCWWGGRTIRTTNKRWGMWNVAANSHHFVDPDVKTNTLILLFYLTNHPKWSVDAARVARANRRMPHESR